MGGADVVGADVGVVEEAVGRVGHAGAGLGDGCGGLGAAGIDREAQAVIQACVAQVGPGQFLLRQHGGSLRLVPRSRRLGITVQSSAEW
jgi:hypothetical protein